MYDKVATFYLMHKYDLQLDEGGLVEIYSNGPFLKYTQMEITLPKGACLRYASSNVHATYNPKL